MTAVKLTCCHLNCQSTADYGTRPHPAKPDNETYACAAHLGELIDCTHQEHGVWLLDDGYDPYQNSREAIDEAKRNEP